MCLGSGDESAAEGAALAGDYILALTKAHDCA